MSTPFVSLYKLTSHFVRFEKLDCDLTLACCDSDELRLRVEVGDCFDQLIVERFGKTIFDVACYIVPRNEIAGPFIVEVSTPTATVFGKTFYKQRVEFVHFNFDLRLARFRLKRLAIRSMLGLA